MRRPWIGSEEKHDDDDNASDYVDKLLDDIDAKKRVKYNNGGIDRDYNKEDNGVKKGEIESLYYRPPSVPILIRISGNSQQSWIV